MKLPYFHFEKAWRISPFGKVKIRGILSAIITQLSEIYIYLPFLRKGEVICISH